MNETHERTGATEDDIVAAARRHFDHSNDRRVLPPWADKEVSKYHRSWVENMRFYAKYLVPPDKGIVDLDDLKWMAGHIDWDRLDDTERGDTVLARIRALIAGEGPR